MIRYKVVSKDRGSCRTSARHHKYYKKYNKDTVVKMTPHSFGIMTFRTIAQARGFQEGHEQILRVESIDKAMRRPPHLFNTRDSELSMSTLYEHFRAHKAIEEIWDIPEGTLFYKAVKILD